jgi:hypothetical protein
VVRHIFFGGLFFFKGLNFRPDEIVNPVHSTRYKGAAPKRQATKNPAKARFLF